MRASVLAFDCFGTVFDLSGVDRAEIRAYVDFVRQPEWHPLTLPDHWLTLPAHPDSAEGIRRLRNGGDRGLFVVTCSNAPLGHLAVMSKAAGIEWDAIIPLELNRVYKPQPKAYLTVCEVLGCEPSDVMMVTANEQSGDLEAARALGMEAMLIRGEKGPKTIIELAELFGR